MQEHVVPISSVRSATPGTPPRSPARSVQEILAADAHPPPPILQMESPRDMGREDLSLDRYYSKAWHDLEVKTIWQKVWQMACRLEDIPHVGDTEVYNIVHDSLIIVRTGPGQSDQDRNYRNKRNQLEQSGHDLEVTRRACAAQVEQGEQRHDHHPAHGQPQRRGAKRGPQRG